MIHISMREDISYVNVAHKAVTMTKTNDVEEKVGTEEQAGKAARDYLHRSQGRAGMEEQGEKAARERDPAKRVTLGP